MCLLKQCPNDWSSDIVSCMERAVRICFSYFTVNQGLTFHPGRKGDGVGFKIWVGLEVAYQEKRSQPANVAVVPNAAIGEGERTLF